MKTVLISFGALALLSASGCDRGDSSAAASGRAAPRGLPARSSAPVAPRAAGPHAGMDMGSPHEGGDHLLGAHAAGDLRGRENPHGGLGAAADPDAVLEGTIDVAPALRDQVKAGDVLFLSAKSVDPATGQPDRKFSAVDRADVQVLPVAFRVGGDPAFEGPVVITARVDRDHEAMSRETGDIEGTVRATFPAKGIKLVLDTPVAP